MHLTNIKMKDGREYNSPIKLFRPKEGYLTLFDTIIENEKLYFKDMESAITKGQRISINVIGDQDEIERAIEYKKDAREFHWDEMDENTPVEDWEKR